MEMSDRKKDGSDRNNLYCALQAFVADAMKYLKQHTEVSQIPTVKSYTLRQDNGRIAILPAERPNWWQISAYLEPIRQLDSYNKALLACRRNDLLNKRNGLVANALNHSRSFSVSDVPGQFLVECIVRENGLRFNKATVSDVYKGLIAFVSSTAQNKAFLLAPLNFIMDERKCVNLNPKTRIKKLSPTSIVNIANRCPMLGHFFGQTFSPWFSTIFEIEFTFNWYWENESSFIKPNLKRLQDMQSVINKQANKLMKELIVLRALLNKRICSPTYVFDYRGWHSVISTGGVINRLPWQDSNSVIPLKIDKKEINHYTKFRDKFLKIKHKTAQRRIFSGMRKLSSALDKNYASDRLFDAVSGLEGLVVSSNTEVSHKLAERTALLLKGKTEEKINLFKEIKKAYNLRSKVAHGNILADDLYLLLGNRKPSEKEIKEFNSVNRLSSLCLQYLNSAIIKFISHGSIDFDWTKSIMSGRQAK